MPTPFPFPVDVPFRIRSDLTPLARAPGGTEAFPPDDDDAATLDSKRAALRDRPYRVRVVADDLPGEPPLDAAVDAAVEALAALRPDAFRRVTSAEALPAAGTTVPGPGGAWAFPLLTDEDVDAVHGLPRAWRLAEATARSLPDDLVFMSAGDGEGRARFLHVAAPSRWAPELHAGSSLTRLHAPVGGGERLRRASPALISAMTRKGPFVRHGFSLVGCDALDLHPDGPHAARADVPPTVDATWFRVERQTIVPAVGLGVATFAIRVFVAPLRQVLHEVPGRAARLADAVASMEPEVLAYKGMTRHGPALIEELRAFDEA